MPNFGRAIRQCRIAKIQTKRDIVRQTNITYDRMSEIESNKTIPHELEQISETLGVPTPVIKFIALNDDEIDGIPLELAQRVKNIAMRLMVHDKTKG